MIFCKQNLKVKNNVFKANKLLLYSWAKQMKHTKKKTNY